MKPNNLSSITIRLDYLTAAARMFCCRNVPTAAVRERFLH